MQKYKEIGEQSKSFISDKMVLSQFNVENYHNQKIMFGKNGYVLFNRFFLERLIKELPITEVGNDYLGIFSNWGDQRKIQVVRIWTNKDVNITPDKMLDDNTYYILEGVGNHPMLKNKITNYLKDVPFQTAIIYMEKQQLIDYQEYAANTNRLSRKFIESNRIESFEDNNNFVKEVLKLDVKQEDVSLAIVYTFDETNRDNDGSEIFERYYGEKERVLQMYRELET